MIELFPTPDSPKMMTLTGGEAMVLLPPELTARRLLRHRVYGRHAHQSLQGVEGGLIFSVLIASTARNPQLKDTDVSFQMPCVYCNVEVTVNV
jgi:hypothetical protein